MNFFKKCMDVSFLVTMLLYVGLGAVIVVIQAVALFTQNGALCLWAKDTFLTPACILCGCTSLISFVMSYVYKWKAAE